MFQTHTSVDLVAACAGFPYGLVDAVRILQEVRRPVLLVCAEKFSDKVGSVRTSRMIFGDGAAALVVAPAPDGVAGDVDVLQTYASGPESQVNSIIWPNVEFGCDITVYGPEVKALVKRYLEQMIGELQTLPHPDGEPGTLVDAIDLIIPPSRGGGRLLRGVFAAVLRPPAGIALQRRPGNVERRPAHLALEARHGAKDTMAGKSRRRWTTGQNDTDMFIEIVRGAPSHAAFSTIAARYEASKRLLATSDTSADWKRSVRPSTENVR